MESNVIYRIKGKEYKDNAIALMEKADLSGMICAKCPDKGRDARILVKPNLVSPTPASYGATTHPEILEACLEYLTRDGFSDITVAEGSWVGAKTEESLDVCGYREIIDKYGVSFRDTKKDGHTAKDCGGLTLNVCDCAFDADYIINLPVLKGHCQTKVTCALKNMKGLIPDSEKRRFHTMGLHEPIAKLSLAIKQDFILVDNICGDPDFEDGGHPVYRDMVLAGTDPVLMDAYGTHLLGRKIDDVPYIRMAYELGSGELDISKADIITLGADESNPDEGAISSERRLVEVEDAVEEVESCSACYGYLIPALYRLQEEGILPQIDRKICIGQGFRDTVEATGSKIGIGNCTKGFAQNIPGCPPTEQEIYEGIKEITNCK